MLYSLNKFQNHRIIEYQVRMDHLIQPLLREGSLDEMAQHPVQLNLRSV